MQFKLDKSDAKSSARAGTITTDHGSIPTPIFMPVGTIGTVKGVPREYLLNDINAPIILGNTYHLYLRPGMDIMQKAGGLHKFSGWDRPLLTDSGGYQVYSLGKNIKITEKGARFKSHIDGSELFFTPEYAIDVQRKIGADIIMAFDECTPFPSTKEYATKSMHLTHRWLKRCMAQMENTKGLYGHSQSLFPIIQGSVFPDLRKQSAEFIAEQNLEGNAIGGLSVGEPDEDMYAMADLVCNILPKDKPRYLMGVGTPANLLENIALGVDMFDCVMPTRNGRNGMIFTSEGIINMKNQRWCDDFGPLDPNGTSEVDRLYTKAYVRHLFKAKEMLGPIICSIHNLAFYVDLVRQAREKILEGTFAEWKNIMVKKVSTRL